MIANKPLLVDCAEDSALGEEDDFREANDGGTAKDQTPRQMQTMLAVTSTSTENVENEVSESAPEQGEEHETIIID